MQRLNNAHIEPGNQYDRYFPQPEWKDSVIKRSADLSDTLALIPKVVQQTLSDTVKISSVLKGKSTKATCSNIWHFVYRHIPYRRDETGKEQIRRPARSWFERKQRKDGSKGGVDCDCYTVFISSVLTNLGIDHTLRVTKNTKDYFQHIYPIVPTGNGRYLTLDCVVDTFDYEAPFK
ncbi:MAG: transglutaminase-like domain-containing protein [Bacteroidota bacterium]